MERRITFQKMKAFERYLIEDEKSRSTIEKYRKDVLAFFKYAGEGKIGKSTVIAYKEILGRSYAVASANSKIAALNKYFRFCGWVDLCVKQFKVQRKVFCPAEKELTRAEYHRLVQAAEHDHNQRLSLVLQTICGTGIRVSELPYMTVEAVQRGRAIVSCKGKTRVVFVVSALRKKLLRYVRERHITAGAIFVTKTGKPMNRCNIWREMKDLCAQAGVSPGKVFPHNLRHLFARAFYGIEKDIAKLADILGHSSINTTRIYISTTGEEHKRYMEHMHLIL